MEREDFLLYMYHWCLCVCGDADFFVYEHSVIRHYVFKQKSPAEVKISSGLLSLIILYCVRVRIVLRYPQGVLFVAPRYPNCGNQIVLTLFLYYHHIVGQDK